MSHHGHHHHHHHHHDEHHDGSQIGQRNEEHFDKVAANIYSQPWIRAISKQVSDELQEQFAWINGATSPADKETKLLDYACGDGMVSRALAKHVSKARGIDISSGMVGQYNAMAVSEGYSQDKMHAVHGDLISTDASKSDQINTPDYKDFNLIVISLALHHVENPAEMVAKLADRLAQGGVLLIIDWVSPAESGCELPQPPQQDSEVKHTVSRMGFEEKEVRGYFEQAGLGSAGWRWFSEKSQLPEEFGGHAQLFMARAVRTSK